jgi:hypothetical protein
MKKLKFAIWSVVAAIVVLLLPALLMKVATLAVPKLLMILAASAMALIPIEIVFFLAYFNMAVIATFLKGMRLRSRGEVIKTLLVFPFGNLLLGYVLVTAIKAFWLR